MSKKNGGLSGAKLLAGVFFTPLLTMIFWQYNAPICVGLFALLTLAFWFVAALRIMAIVYAIKGSLPSRQTLTPITQPTKSNPTTSSDDSRSIFL